MHLSKKQKRFSQFFGAFLKFTSNFEHFERKDELDSLCICQMGDCERRG